MTAKSTRAGLRKIRSSFFAAFFLLPVLTAHAYIDMVAIETPNSVKTVYDIRVHSFFRHLYERQTIIDPSTPEWMSSYFESERKNFVEQFLAQNYVNENNLDLKPAREQISNGMKSIEKSFKDPAQRKKVFDALNIEDEEMLEWVTARLTFEKFMDDILKNRVILNDRRLEEHYQTWKSTRFLGKPYADVKSLVEKDLTKTLLDEEFEKWVDQEKRRKKMILKTLPAS